MEGKLQGLKIAWLLQDFPNAYQEYIKNLFLNLKRTYGLEITIVTYKLSQSDFALEHPVKVIKANGILDEFMKRITFSKFSKLEKYLDRFDLVHVQQSFLYPFISTLSNSIQRPYFVITFRGGDSYIKPWVSPKWRTYHQEIRDRFDGIQVMSDNQKKYLLKWGHNLDNVYTIPISTSTRSDAFVTNKIEQPLKLCSVFRMIWEKNIEVNLRLVRELVNRNIDVQYNVYGDGVDMGQLYYLVDRFELSQNVEIFGRVAPGDLAHEIMSGHLLLQLSSSEALPASVIEALSFGIPCVVSDVGGFPEIIQSGINGYLMDFNSYDLKGAADFIESLTTNNEMYQQLKQGAFDTFKRDFSPIVEAEKVYKMYSSIIKQ